MARYSVSRRAPKKVARRMRLKKGLRKKIYGHSDRPRLSVFRSNTSIYAQIIDDEKSLTLVSASSRSSELKELEGTKTELSKAVGKKLAELAQAKGIQKVVFDRNGYNYHGRVKALADGARESGLEF